MKEHKKLEDCRLPFLNILFGSKSFEDAKIKAKSTDMTDVILVTSYTLNKYSLDSQATVSPNLANRTN